MAGRESFTEKLTFKQILKDMREKVMLISRRTF